MSDIMPKILKLIEIKDKLIKKLDSDNKRLQEISDKAVESIDSININDIRIKNINFVASNPFGHKNQKCFNCVEGVHDW
jgi:hypothetical protein